MADRDTPVSLSLVVKPACPALNISEVKQRLNVSTATASKLIKEFEQKNILVQTNNMQRYREFLFKKYMDIIEEEL